MIINYVDCANGKFINNQNGKILEHIFTGLPFRIQKITLSPKDEKSDKIISEARLRLSKIKFNVANSSGTPRNEDEVRMKSFCGLITEQLCYSMLNYYNKNENVKIKLDDSQNSINQIDMKIYKTWRNGNSEEKTSIKTVEIRASFPFFSVEKAVSKNFDIIGRYKNNVKIGEIEKDFYLRFLFSLNYPKELYVLNGDNINYSETTTNTLQSLYFDSDLNLKRDMIIYFIGGATKTMMQDDSISYVGTMKSVNFNQDSSAHFQKLKMCNALDCISIMQMMLNVITRESVEGK